MDLGRRGKPGGPGPGLGPGSFLPSPRSEDGSFGSFRSPELSLSWGLTTPEACVYGSGLRVECLLRKLMLSRALRRAARFTRQRVLCTPRMTMTITMTMTMTTTMTMTMDMTFIMAMFFTIIMRMSSQIPYLDFFLRPLFLSLEGTKGVPRNGGRE